MNEQNDVEVEFTDVIDSKPVEPTLELAAKVLDSTASAIDSASELLPDEHELAAKVVAQAVSEKAGQVRETGVHVQAAIDDGKKLSKKIEDMEIGKKLGEFGDLVSKFAGDRRFARRF